MNLLSLSIWVNQDGKPRIVIEITDETNQRRRFIGETFSIAGDKILVSGGFEVGIRNTSNRSNESSNSDGSSNQGNSENKSGLPF